MFRSVKILIGLAAMVTLLGGCLSTYTTRMPSLNLFNHQNPEIEKRSYEIHDPYPDESIGPETITRPRAFNIQRTEERKTFEQKAFGNNGIPHGTAAPRLPTSQYQYPDAIRQ